MFRLLTIFALSACGPSERESDAKAYAVAMQAMFRENKAISREFLDVAGMLKKSEINAIGVAERFDERVVPRARKLAAEVKEVAPGNSGLEPVHVGIVRAWTIRADSYAAMSEAVQKSDLAAYTRAMHDNRAVRKAEDRYIEAANTLLLPYEVQLDPYP
jgi:hypothetical protein